MQDGTKGSQEPTPESKERIGLSRNARVGVREGIAPRFVS